jgi:hypothetical protein
VKYLLITSLYLGLHFNLFSQYLTGATYFPFCPGTENINCFGEASGIITINYPTWGIPPYQYKLNQGSYQSSNIFSHLNPGNYIITIKDNTGDTVVLNSYITQPADPLQVAAVVNSATDSSAFDGCITVAVYGGTEPYSYYWSNGVSVESMCGLPGGTYCLTVTDANGCQFDTCLTVDIGPPSFNVWVYATNTSCYYSADGLINATVIGGMPPYMYKLDNGNYQNSNIFNNLAAGVYIVTVKDQLNHTSSTPVAVHRPNQIYIIGGVTNATSLQTNDGAIVTLTGEGTAPYTFIWSDTNVQQNRNNLQSGNYTVTVTDFTGCTGSAEFTVAKGITPLSFIANVSNPLCYGNSDATINLIPYGGVQPCSYLWNTSNTTPGLDSLLAGVYFFTISDALGTQVTDSITINEPAGLFSYGYVNDVSCNGESNGIINITPYGGRSPFTYEWSNGDTTQDLFMLNGGTYFLTITDRNNCNSISLYYVNEPTALSIQSTAHTIHCNADSVGPIAVIPIGGTLPYHYEWNNGSVDSAIIGPPCNYQVLVTDAHDCSASANFTATPINFLPIDYEAIICAGDSYTFMGIPRVIGGLYTDTVKATGCGCDTLYSLNLTSLSNFNTVIYDTIINVEDYNFGGQIINSSGTYYDTLTGSNTCDSIVTLHLTMQFTVGINYISKDSIKIYPIPAKDKIRVVSNTNNITMYQIINIEGAEVKREMINASNFEIDLTQLSVGYYTLKLKHDDLEIQKPLIKM